MGVRDGKGCGMGEERMEDGEEAEEVKRGEEGMKGLSEVRGRVKD